jgi:hypothetical protein
MELAKIVIACLAFLIGCTALWQQHMWRREGNVITEVRDKMRSIEKGLQRLTRTSNHYYIAIREHVVGWIKFYEEIAEQIDNKNKVQFVKQLRSHREKAFLQLRKMELAGASCELQHEALMYFVGSGKCVNKDVIKFVRLLLENGHIESDNRTLALRIING